MMRLMAPYVAVGVFWCWFGNGWMAVLAYHLQIVLWAGRERQERGRVRAADVAVFVLPCALAGPAMWFLLPLITTVDLGTWLVTHGLSGMAWTLMVPYFGIVHPVLEQLHWGPLRRRTAVSHFCFAGYHMLVLFSLLRMEWLMVCFVVLAGVSVLWGYLSRRTGGILLPVLSHMAADSAIVVVALLKSLCM